VEQIGPSKQALVRQKVDPQRKMRIDEVSKKKRHQIISINALKVK